MNRELLRSAAEEFGTPLYVYDAGVIRSNFADLTKAIDYPNFRMLYAMKANYNPHILQLLKELGASIDAVSPGDVLMAKKCGYPAEKILYTANNITAAEMHEVASSGVVLNIGSLSELEKYGKAYPGTKVFLRFNPAIVAGAHKKIQTAGDLSKFGILKQSVEKAVSIAKQYQLRVIGLHKHTGSGIEDQAEYLKAVANLFSLAIPEYFPDLETLDLGGGIYVPYEPWKSKPDYKALGEKVIELLKTINDRYGRDLGLQFEPGKYLVAEAGKLIIEVTNFRNNNGVLIAGTNSGFSQLIRPTFYDAYHHIENLSNPDGEIFRYDIVGNICENGDKFAEYRDIPEIKEGHKLAIHHAGAYCYSMGSLYNLRAMPAEVMMDGDKVTLIRKRLSSEELVSMIYNECYGV